jgi:hypothetical protein
LQLNVYCKFGSHCIKLKGAKFENFLLCNVTGYVNTEAAGSGSFCKLHESQGCMEIENEDLILTSNVNILR